MDQYFSSGNGAGSSTEALTSLLLHSTTQFFFFFSWIWHAQMWPLWHLSLLQNLQIKSKNIPEQTSRSSSAHHTVNVTAQTLEGSHSYIEFLSLAFSFLFTCQQEGPSWYLSVRHKLMMSLPIWQWFGSNQLQTDWTDANTVTSWCAMCLDLTELVMQDFHTSRFNC